MRPLAYPLAFVLLLGTANVTAQDLVPVIAAPLPGVQVETESATVVYVDGRWQLVEADAVKQTSALLRIEGNPNDLEVVVSRWVVRGGEVEELIGRAYLVTAGTDDLEYRLDVPSSGRWRVEVVNYETRRRVTTYVTIGDVDPEPSPDPAPPTPPAPPPSEAPFRSPGFAVLIVREASEAGKLPASQRAIFSSGAVHQYCADKCVQLSDGQKFYRIWDDDYSDAQVANVPAELREAYQGTKELWDANTPWIGINDGKGGGYAGPLPATVDEMLALLKKYGGER